MLVKTRIPFGSLLRYAIANEPFIILGWSRSGASSEWTKIERNYKQSFDTECLYYGQSPNKIILVSK